MSNNKKKKGSVFAVIQQVGKSFFLPVSVLPIAGILLGLGASFTNADTIAAYHLTGIMGEGTLLNGLLTIMSQVGNTIFGNLPLIFALAVALGMAKNEKAVAVLSAGISFFVMNSTINAMLKLTGKILADGTYAKSVLNGQITSVCGIDSLQMGVFAGVLVGLVTAALHNRFYKQELPAALAFFSGVRFVPIICVFAHIGVGIICYFIWPIIQSGIFALGNLVMGTGYIGTAIFGFLERALIPFGLHHVFYIPFWQTSLGGTMEVAGKMVEGAQNIFFAQLADPATKHFSVEACRFMTGKYPFMMAGLPGAAYAMYRCAKPEKRKLVGGLLFSAALTSFLTGITEPIEFTFLFIAPGLFILHCGLAGLSFAIMHILKICIGTTFSCGLIDFMLYGVLQGQQRSNWLMIIPVFALYAVLYYFVFKLVIEKFNLPTPGRDDNEEEVKLYTKADFQAKQGNAAADEDAPDDMQSLLILKGLGGLKNIEDIDCCATRLRITVEDENKVTDSYLKQSGSKGIIKKGNGIQVIYGPQVPIVKSNFEEFVQYYTTKGTDPSVEEVSPIEDSSAPVTKQKEIGHGKLLAVADGNVLAMTEAKDKAFSSCAMGDGYIVKPTKGVVVAPADGKITALIEPSLHAVGIETKEGLNLLIHIGIDTVKLEGKGFKAFVENGQEVKAGDKLVEFDINIVKEAGYAPDILVIVLEDENLQKVDYKVGQNADAGTTVVAEY
ncbi:MAG: glucose PTS transporter subunit IIA [Anaerostipes sp.]|nr:glucose PTS transporter subunit IIA [Anaerostipes sp.]